MPSTNSIKNMNLQVNVTESARSLQRERESVAGRNQRPPKWRDRPYRFLDWTLNAVDTFLTGDITGTGLSFCKNPTVNNVLKCQLFPRRPTDPTQSQCTPSKVCFAEINQLIQSPRANAHDCQAFRAVTAVRLCIRAKRKGPV